MTKNRTPTPVYLDPGMHPGLEVKGLIAETVFELQEKLDVLYEVATKLGLIVNIDKSKVLVFRKGCRLAAIEKWHAGGKKL